MTSKPDTYHITFWVGDDHSTIEIPENRAEADRVFANLCKDENVDSVFMNLEVDNGFAMGQVRHYYRPMTGEAL